MRGLAVAWRTLPVKVFAFAATPSPTPFTGNSVNLTVICANEKIHLQL